jgi:gliding motility-associated-like protein
MKLQAAKCYTLIILFTIFCTCVFCQYTVNGNAVKLTCNEYLLTNASNTQSGSVWNNNKINLTQSFDFKFDVFLGSKDVDGADGIAFVLQPISTSVGSSGGGLGYENITPAVGVTLDTWQNTNNNDPTFDHVAIQLNGDLNHSSANNIAGPVQAGINQNIEDGAWHALRIVWEAATYKLTVYIDGIERATATKNFIADVFNANPLVFWGFTGSTGGSNNIQKFRTALNPAFNFLPTQKRCVNEPIQFRDSTISFTNIVKFYWDFGDGSPIDSVNLNPSHTYFVGGDYTVVQRVIGADGCEATNTQVIRVGTIPTVRFDANTINCAESVPLFGVAATQFGTIDSTTWRWNLDNGIIGTTPVVAATYSVAGTKTITVSVKSVEGCEAPAYTNTINVYTSVLANFTFSDSVCAGQPITFNAQLDNIGGNPSYSWRWWFDTSTVPSALNVNPISYTFSTAGTTMVRLVASANGQNNYCMKLVTKTVYVKSKPTAKIGLGSPLLCAGNNILFVDSSIINNGVINKWSWQYNNTEFATQQNATLAFAPGIETVKLIATANNGCADTTTRTIVINAAPDVTFNANNGCKLTPLNFSAIDNGGNVINWKWDFGDGTTALTQNAVHTYVANKVYTVKLTAANATGCSLTNLQKDITIYGTNAFAGNDTIASAGQPLQLRASGGLSYTWSPANLLNNPFIDTPTTILNTTQTFTLKAFTPEGCESYDDVTVKIYKGPDIYLPNAFTPNNDGKNDILRGIPVGLKQFNYMKVFNRWGQLIFNTTNYTYGWDGKWQTKQQPAGAYVVIVKGTDFKGNIIEKKVSVLLVR